MLGTGGRRALLGAVLLDLAVSPLFTWGVYRDRLADDLGSSGRGLDVAYAVSLAAFTVGVLVGGRIADAVAPRKLAWFVAAGLLTGLALVAAAQSVAAVVVGHGVLFGAAAGLGYATAVRVAAVATGCPGVSLTLVVSAYAAGAVALAPLLDLAWQWLGRGLTMGTLAAVLVVLVMFGALALPSEAPSMGRSRNQRGRTPALRAYFPRLLVAWAMFAFGSAPALVAFGHAGGLAGGATWAVAAVVLLNAGNLGGRLVAGPLAERFGHVLMLHLVAAALVGVALVLALDVHAPTTLGALLVLGLQYGAVSVLVPMAVAGAVPAERFGAAYGLVFTGWGIVGLSGPVFAGLWVDLADYRAVAAGMVLSGLLFWASLLAWQRGGSPPLATEIDSRSRARPL